MNEIRARIMTPAAEYFANRFVYPLAEELQRNPELQAFTATGAYFTLASATGDLDLMSAWVLVNTTAVSIAAFTAASVALGNYFGNGRYAMNGMGWAPVGVFWGSSAVTLTGIAVAKIFETACSQLSVLKSVCY